MKRALLWIAGTTALGLCATSPAGAVNWNSKLGCGQEADFAFEGAGWDVVVDGQSKRYWALTGINQWQTAQEALGGQLAQYREVAAGSTGTIDVVLDPTPHDDSGTRGYARCNPDPIIEINANMNDGPLIRTVAAHEYGHHLGLEHVGEDMSFDGLLPTMMTCRPDDTQRNTKYSQEDEAHLSRMRAEQDPRPIMANSSLERGTTYWGVAAQDPATPPTFATSVTNGGSEGQTYARFRPQRGGDNLYQTVVLSKGDSRWLIDARWNIRQDPAANGLYGATSGSTRLEMLTREGEYFGTSSCEYKTNKNENDYRLTDSLFVVRQFATGNAGAAWSFTTTPQYETPADPDAIGLRIRLFSNVKTPAGALTWVDFDHARPRAIGFPS